MSAHVDEPYELAVPSAPDAQPADTERVTLVDMLLSGRLPGGPLVTLLNERPSEPPTEPAAATGRTPGSSPSDAPSGRSNKRWRSPKTPLEMAQQASVVATMVLNGEMPIEQARTYAAIARTVAQALSSESARARSAKEVPELRMDGDVFE